MSGAGLINEIPIGNAAINETDVPMYIANAAIAIDVNSRMSTVINASPINTNPVGGFDIPDVRLIQVHVLGVDDVAIAVAAGSPTLSMSYLLSVHNAGIHITASSVRLSKARAGALLVKVTTPEADVYRYSFEGIKA